jgi:hypothetical protein
VSIESDVLSALSGVPKVYPNAAPQDAAPPYVIYRTQSEPLMTLQGYAGNTKVTFTFEAWAATKAAAMTKRNAVQTAIDAAFSTLAGYREPPEQDTGYDPELDVHMQACAYSFWTT